MIKLDIPVVVEGKYDKAKLSGVVDAPIITTAGFAVFNNEEKRALIRKLGERGVILLCDSDGGGRLIRSHLKGMLGGATVYDLYIPEIVGKERRKRRRSAAGFLGVEGVDSDVLRGIFASFAEAHPEHCCECERAERATVTKSMLFEMGLNGTPSAAERRATVCSVLGLPREMSANAFCEAVNLISTEEEIRRIVDEIE